MWSVTEMSRVIERLVKPEFSSRHLPMPEIIPDSVGTCLVYELKNDPDYIWKLKAVRRPWPNNRKIYHFRVYDEVETDKQHVRVEDYFSLDAHPDLILWQGVCDSAFYKVFIKGVHEATVTDTESLSVSGDYNTVPVTSGGVN